MTIAEEPQLDGETKRTHRAGPAPFSASYDKARRSYGVATALLLAWALVGIELNKTPLHKRQGHVEKPRSDAVRVYRRCAVPRVSLHGRVVSSGGRAAGPSRFAGRLQGRAYAGASAILVFTGQRLWHVQLADALSAYYHHALTFAVAFVLMTSVILSLHRFPRRERVKAAMSGSIAAVVILAVAGWEARRISGWPLPPLLPAALVGITAGIVVGFAVRGDLRTPAVGAFGLLRAYLRSKWAR